MAKRVVLSPEADDDRLEILDYWFNRLGHKEYSANLDKKFRKAFRLLASFPEIGKRVEGGDERMYVVRPYEMFYRDQKENIDVLRIWDSRRNSENLKL